jgi:hypothetical protein
MKSTLIALGLLVCYLFSSSEQTNKLDYTAQNEKEITDYLTAKKNSTAVKRYRALYIINEPDTGLP